MEHCVGTSISDT